MKQTSGPASRTEATRIGGVTVQIVRDWVVKVNAHGPDGLIDRRAHASIVFIPTIGLRAALRTHLCPVEQGSGATISRNQPQA